LRRSARQIELQEHLALPPAQNVDIPSRKKPRRETPIAITMALPPATDIDDDDRSCAAASDAETSVDGDGGGDYEMLLRIPRKVSMVMMMQVLIP
jgi:hypothetical protein